LLRVRDIGEQGLLQRLQAFCPTGIVGDDAAVLNPSPGRSLVVTSDVLVDGVHFSDRTTTPEDAGWRAAAANLSDLAAMGAIPLGITVGLALPGDVAVDWVDRLYQGMTECLQHYGTAIVGGDVVRSPILSVAITAFGEADPNQIIRRNTARVGDAIVATGYHGASRAGLELLLHPELGTSLIADERSALIRAHQRPRPRLDVLPLLWGTVNSQQSTVNSQQSAVSSQNVYSELKSPHPTPHTQPPTPSPLNSPTSPTSPSSLSSSSSSSPLPIAGMDSSDGLADAVIQICRASKLGAQIMRDRLPIPPPFKHWLSPEQALAWILYGGEDFELVLCLPTNAAEELVQQLGEGAAVIGTVTAEPEIWLVDSCGHFPNQPLTMEQGFQHFGEERSAVY
jgi:thiamine-monophosphate kinase